MTNPPDPKTKTPRTDKCLSQYDDFGQYRSEPRRLELLAIESSTLELENQSLTRRLEEATKERDAMRSNWDVTTGMLQQSRKQLDGATAKLTALRTAAEGARDALNRAFWVAERQIEKLESDKRDSEFWQGEAGKIGAALAALRAELDQADSNASNSPTDSLESQG